MLLSLSDRCQFPRSFCSFYPTQKGNICVSGLNSGAEKKKKENRLKEQIVIMNGGFEFPAFNYGSDEFIDLYW